MGNSEPKYSGGAVDPYSYRERSHVGETYNESQTSMNERASSSPWLDSSQVRGFSKFLSNYLEDQLIQTETERNKSYKSIREAIEDLDISNENKAKLLEDLNHYEALNTEGEQQKLAQQAKLFDEKLSNIRRGRWVWTITRLSDKKVVASLSGAILVIAWGGLLAAASWQGKPDMPILQSAFFVVLGYFFAQSAISNGETSKPSEDQNFE